VAQEPNAVAKKRFPGTGGIFNRKGSRFLYISYPDPVSGEPIQESTKSELRSVAEEMLRKKLEQSSQGFPLAEMKRWKYEDAREALLEDYRDKGNRSLLKYKSKLPAGLTQHIDPFFKGRLCKSIDTAFLHAFKNALLKKGLAPASVNRLLAMVRRMLNIAKRDSKLAFTPYVPTLKEENTRTGFCEPDEFATVLAHLPEHLHAIALFMYQTGCRSGAAKKIGWNQVEERDGKLYIRLLGIQTKNKEGLLLRLSTELAELLRKRFRIGLLFDHRNLRKEWEASRKQAGFPSLLMHDMRRSGARNLIAAGVDEKTVMVIGGWKTRSVFLRYQIVSTKNIDDATDKLEAASGSLLEVAEKLRKDKA
jgi:integrase